MFRGRRTRHAPDAARKVSTRPRRARRSSTSHRPARTCDHRVGGVEVDHTGVVWQNWRVSGQFATFDRSKCDTTSDPTASGQSCPEGWTFYRKDDPTYTDSFYHANESYLAHMDHHDVLGLGKDSAMYGSVNTDAIEVFSSNTG